MATNRLVVLSSPVAGREAEFETWYDEVHLRDVASVDGVSSASRMRVLDITGNPAGTPRWRSLAIYEFGADPELVLPRIAQLRESGGMEISTALDRSGLVKMIVMETNSVVHGIKE